MKHFFLLLLLCCTVGTLTAQNKHLQLSIRDFNPKRTGVDRATAERAVKIATEILNSQEFRDSLNKYSYRCNNYYYYCEKKCSDCNILIPTQVILDSLYRIPTWELDLTLLNRGGSYGETSEDSHEIESHYKTIENDDYDLPYKLPFEYKYAYHLCHEYMHIVGFYHFEDASVREIYTDIAESAGYIAYYILKARYERESGISH